MSHRRRPRPSQAAKPEFAPVRPQLTARTAPRTRLRSVDVAIGVCLIAATVLVYAQVGTHGFLTHDDPEYVTANPHVTSGLTAAGAAWALTAGHDANWFPLTWLSHMADVQVFGLNAGAHHLDSVALHAISAVLLFGLFRRMTGARWPSALVACLFALHPLHVESVAWVAERKDVLSGLFWMLTLTAYVGYVERPGRLRYALVLAAFGLGLMAKSMIVTLPFVLLLLDWWPLGRWSPAPNRPMARAALVPLIREKLPLLALSAAVSVVTFFVQRSAGAVASVDAVPLVERMANAVVSYEVYVRDMIWPAGLAVFYPLRPVETSALILAAILIVAISAGVVRAARRRPYLAVGWFWYLGTLVPVIGLIQVGSQSHADRYTYIPSIGITVAAAWGLAEIAGRWPRFRMVVAGLAAAACAAAGVVTWRQLPYWQNSESLFEHAIEVTGDNYVAHFNLGLVRRSEGRLDRALAHYERAVMIRPAYPEAQNNIAEILIAENRISEALPHVAEALRLRPDLVDAQVNLGIASTATGRAEAAEAAFRSAVRLAPNNAQALEGLGRALSELGRPDEGIRYLTEAVRLEPDRPAPHAGLAAALVRAGRANEANTEFSTAIRLQPASPQAHFDLGTLLVGQARLSEAASEFAEAVRLKPDYVRARVNLGSALASLGKYDEAIAQFTEALRLQPDLTEARRNLEYALELRARATAR
jgi:tetratricopeptide (TPR) repeat protein